MPLFRIISLKNSKVKYFAHGWLNPVSKFPIETDDM